MHIATYVVVFQRKKYQNGSILTNIRTSGNSCVLKKRSELGSIEKQNIIEDIKVMTEMKKGGKRKTMKRTNPKRKTRKH